ncbi:MAG: CDP-alcohol phosphatidyltransferase family protein [Desulfobacterales bacterium]
MQGASTANSASTVATERPGQVPARLRYAAACETAWHAVLLLSVNPVLSRMMPPTGSEASLTLAAGVLATVHWGLWRNLRHNHPPSGTEIRPHLGIANRLTLIRGLLIALLAGCLPAAVENHHFSASRWAWIAGILYLTAAILDALDGYCARRTGSESRLGQMMDVRTDALGLLTASTLAVTAGRLPVYYLSVGLAYYVYRFGLWLRRKSGKPVLPQGPRAFARWIAGLQMGLAGVALLPVFDAEALQTAAPCFVLPLLMGFVWDWSVVRGRISGDEARFYQQAIADSAARVTPVLRGMMLLTGLACAWNLRSIQMTGTSWLALLLILMVVTGFLGRTAGFLLSLLLANAASEVGTSPLLKAALAGAVVIMIAGTGRWSLWRPEDTVIYRNSAGRSRHDECKEQAILPEPGSPRLPRR